MNLSAGLERAIGLLDPARRPPAAHLSRPEASPPAPPQVDGYIDLLGRAGRPAGKPAQRLMLTRALPVVYERWWRPTWGRMVMGPLGPGTAGEHRIAAELLELVPGDTVLDIACGPGNFVRDFAGAVGRRGLVVGLDASPTMLARGRLAILTSARAPLTPAPVGALIGAATGLRVFGREEITRALEERGFEDVRRRVSGLAQFVGARRAPA